jgi:branched-chain amino acid transport system substrate-binding protein
MNEHTGGIAGHKVQIVECDTQSDPAKGTDCGNQMVEQKVPVVVIGQSAVLDNAWQPLHAAHLPVLIYSANGTGELADAQSTFILADPIASAVEVPLAVAKAAKTKKVAAVVIDVPQATDLFKTTAPPLFKKAGISLQLIPVPLGTPDLTPQLQALATNGTGEAFVVGNDALCISAFNGLKAVGYTGKIAAVAQCVTDNTRKAVPGDILKGMVISAQAPIGTNDPSMKLYTAVAKKYGTNIDLADARGAGVFTVLMALGSGVAGATGDLTSDSITAAMKAAPAAVLQAAGGLKFQCNGQADSANPAVCSAGVLTATLDEKGNPVSYKASQ